MRRLLNAMLGGVTLKVRASVFLGRGQILQPLFNGSSGFFGDRTAPLLANLTVPVLKAEDTGVQ
jgi:hypothetical protein